MKLNLLLFLGVLAAFILSLAVGPAAISLSDLASGSTASLIIMELRLPRALIGVIVGAALGASGAAMQGYLRNPLADPGLFGVSSSAALGAVASLFFGFAVSAWILPAFALTGACLGMVLLALLTGKSGSLILFTLAGITLSSLTSALTALLVTMAPTPFAASEIITWLMGALTDRSWDDVFIALPLTILGLTILAFAARSLDALTLGEVAARTMGVSMPRLQLQIVLGIGLCVGGSVAVAGVIGFVGLIVPHLVRPLTGHRPSALLLPAALVGALLVILSDMLIRILPLQTELRLGIAMSLLGAPFFLALLLQLRREVA